MDELADKIASGASDARVGAIEEAATEAARSISNRVARALLDCLSDPEPRIRRAALESIGGIAHRGAHAFGAGGVDAVARLADDPVLQVRAEAAVALGILDDAESALAARVRTLARLIEDDAPEVRREAAAALGDTGSPEARGHLVRHLEDEDAQTRFEAAFALASIGDDSGLELLVAALSSSRRRLDACEALYRLKSEEAIGALEQTARRIFVGWPERLTLWATLYSLGRTDFAASLIDRVGARSRQERALALGLIDKHAVVEAAPAVRQVASTRKDPLQGTAIRALGGLGQAEDAAMLWNVASDEAYEVDLRVDATEALAMLPNGRDYLRRLHGSQTAEVAEAARSADGPAQR